MQQDTTVFRSDCPLSSWLDLFGDKWSLLVLRDVAFRGKKNFKEFLEAPEGIATNILSDRLKTLVSRGLLTKSVNSANKSKFDYEVTDKALQLFPIVMEIAKWSNANLPHTFVLEPRGPLGA